MSAFLKDFFDAAYLINLKRRRDRLVRFHRRMEEIGGWPFCELKVIEAVDGSVVPAPVNYKSGGGAWGCRQSHIQIHQEALMAGHEKILIFEDDAEFRDDFVGKVEELLKNLPNDWEGVMFGGQNMKPTEAVGVEGINRCANTQRTHAMAFRGDAIRDVLRMYYSVDVHIDWRLGPFLGSRRKTYCPVPFMVGQSSSKSDITYNRNTAKFWNAPDEDIPSVLLVAPRHVAEFCRKHGCHYGAHLDEFGNDIGLNEMFPAEGQYTEGLMSFMNTMKWEGASFAEAPAIPTVWHINLTKELAENLIVQHGEGGYPKIVLVIANTVGEATKKIKDNELLQNLFFERARGTRKPVILLKTSLSIAERLQDEMIIHTGYWKDEQTGIDVGLQARFHGEGRVDLRDWYTTVAEEADHINALAGIFHPKATKAIAETTGERVVVIEATSYEEAVQKADAAIP